MELDVEYMKIILVNLKNGKIIIKNKEIKVPNNGIDNVTINFGHKSYGKTEEEISELNKFHYHLKILIDNKFLYGHIGGSIDSYPPFKIQGLTLQGHQFLEATENDNLLEKIKKSIKSITMGTIEKVPALAIGAILSASLK